MAERDVDRLDSDDLLRAARDGLAPPRAASDGGDELDATADCPPTSGGDDDETPDAPAGGVTEAVESGVAGVAGDDVAGYFSAGVDAERVLPELPPVSTPWWLRTPWWMSPTTPPKRFTRPWRVAARRLGLEFEEVPSGLPWKASSLAMGGHIDGYRVTVSETKLGGGESTKEMIQTRFHVYVPGLPIGLSIRRRKAILRKRGRSRKRFVLVGDDEWDENYAVKADDHDAAILYLSQHRRQQIDAAASDFSFSVVYGSGVETSIPKEMDSARTIVHQVEGTIAAARSVDPRH